MSSVKWPAPVRKRWSSRRLTGWPMPNCSIEMSLPSIRFRSVLFGYALRPLWRVKRGRRKGRSGRVSARLRDVAGDQPRAALIGQVGPKPVERHDQAVAEADQEIDVGNAPHQPGDAPGQPQPAEIDDGLAPSDRREVAVVAVAERRGRGPAGEACCDDSRDIGTLLLRDRCDARQGAGLP